MAKVRIQEYSPTSSLNLGANAVIEYLPPQRMTGNREAVVKLIREHVFDNGRYLVLYEEDANTVWLFFQIRKGKGGAKAPAVLRNAPQNRRDWGIVGKGVSTLEEAVPLKTTEKQFLDDADIPASIDPLKFYVWVFR